MIYSPTAFEPAWWLPGPHSQTLGARVLRSPRGVRFCRERLTTPDGDFVDLDFVEPPMNDPERAMALVLHGLEGSARSKYAIEAYRALQQSGIDSVGFNFRSCSGELNRRPRSYHSGETGDLDFVVRWLSTRYPGRSLVALGFSLGGNVLLKYLGERGPAARATFAAAAAISVPFDLSSGAEHLRRVGGRLYSTYLLRKLRRKIRSKRAIMPPSVDVTRACRATSFREFDDAATAPLHGFDGAEDYYRRSSSEGFLAAIHVPTLLVHAEDDPFLPARAIPRSVAEGNPNLVTAFTRRGGHVGFVAAGPPWRPRFWAETEVARFFSHVLGSSGGGAPVLDPR